RDDDRDLLHPALLQDHPRARRGPARRGFRRDRSGRDADDGARMTRRRTALLAALPIVCVSACLAGPRYVPETVVGSSERVGVTRTSDSSRAFFDSLAAARRADTARIAAVPAVRRLAVNDSLASLAWLDLLRDTTLVRMVDVALKQNRDLRVAE